MTQGALIFGDILGVLEHSAFDENSIFKEVKETPVRINENLCPKKDVVLHHDQETIQFSPLEAVLRRRIQLSALDLDELDLSNVPFHLRDRSHGILP